MANRVCRPVVEIPDYLVGTVIVPDGVTLYPGDIIVADTYTSAIAGNWSVFAATKPITANLGEQMAVIINGGFEMLPDGRRPDGQPDFTKYEFIAGDVVTIIFLTPQARFEISNDCITGTPIVGDFLFPVDDSYKVSKGAAIPVGTFSSLKVLALKNFRLGGLYGAQFAPTVICSVRNPA